MIQVGILNAYFPYTLEESAQRIREHGFNTVQFDFTGGLFEAGLIGGLTVFTQGGKILPAQLSTAVRYVVCSPSPHKRASARRILKGD